MGNARFEVRWTKRAQIDPTNILNHIAADAPKRAIAFAERIEAATESLTWSPVRCSRIKEVPSCRHMIVKKYRLVFEIDEQERVVWINAIVFPYQQFHNR